ncbi:MAG: DUF4962 domain-containing protein [Planctomycetes bacterium]|nr:DUF4962 domain-containing protein [Planctomycetota bacterium]
MKNTHSYPQAIHPVTRQTAWPSDDTVVDVNPPSLLWPVVKRQDIRYRVRLSQDPHFHPDKTIRSNDLPWAIFNPHKELTYGKWHWRYEVLRDGKVQSVSKVHSFIVSNSARAFVTPTAKLMLSACPKSHPRILITSDGLAAFRKRAKNSQQAKSIIDAADKFIGCQPPAENSAIPRQKGKNAFEQKNYAKWASKALGNQLSASTSALARAYIITGDKKYGRQAVSYAIHVAKFDPDGITSTKVSDFANGTCLRSMALAYDSCFDLLTPQEKIRLRKAIAIRAGRMFASWRNNLENRVFSAHIWQHILHEFAEAAFATLGEIEDAEQWASYIYELWLARVPLLGGCDGGWANGNNYFGTNFVTLISIPTFFEQLTGVDFFSHPWYRNAIYYMIYTWPPRSAPDGFGDGCEKQYLAPLSRLAFADILGRKFNDSYAGWYVRESMQPLRSSLQNDSSQKWHRLRAGYNSPAPIRSSFDLPQARLFRDIGVVAMHKDLADTSNNLMLAFCSSPFGSYNHAHANQNSFNILFGGKRLYSNSGYYIAYADDHFKGWYKHSRGHNTVLIDNKGQLVGKPEGYGWIARYLHGQRITYCLGDASNAYGDAGLTLFRRHIVFLRPSIVVIYDELEADHPAQWSWLLHCPEKISSDSANNCLIASIPSARSKVDFFAPIPLSFDVHDRFDPPALNWRNRTSGGKVIQYPNQWHASVSPEGEVNKMRYLAIIQVLDKNTESQFTSPRVLGNHVVQVGAWSIDAELDPTIPAALEIRSSDQKAALAVNKASITISSQQYETTRQDSSILIEKLPGRDIVIESSDSGPTQ